MTNPRSLINDEHVVLAVLLSNYVYKPTEKSLAALNKSAKAHGVAFETVAVSEKYAVLTSSTGDVFVCFRGTADYTDILRDLTPCTTTRPDGKYKIHAGINTHVNNLPGRDKLIKEVAELLRDNPSANVVFTGHSLGGATAQLMYVSFLDANTALKDRASCYAFGAPFFGDAKWRQYCEEKQYAQKCFNIVNELDMVPPWSNKHGKYSIVAVDAALFACSTLVPMLSTAFETVSLSHHATAVTNYEYMGNLIVLSKNWVSIKYATSDPSDGKQHLPLRGSKNAHLVKTYMKAVQNVFSRTTGKLPKSKEKQALTKEAAAVDKAVKDFAANPEAKQKAPSSPPKKPTCAEVQGGLAACGLPPEVVAKISAILMKGWQAKGADSSSDSSSSSDDESDDVVVLLPDDDGGSSGGNDGGVAQMAVLDRFDAELEEEIAAPLGAADNSAIPAKAKITPRELFRERFVAGDRILPDYATNLSKRTMRKTIADLCELSRFVTLDQRETVIEQIRRCDKVLGTRTAVPESVREQLDDAMELLQAAGFIDGGNSAQRTESARSRNTPAQEAPRIFPRPPSPARETGAEATRLFTPGFAGGAEADTSVPKFNFTFPNSAEQTNVRAKGATTRETQQTKAQNTQHNETHQNVTPQQRSQSPPQQQQQNFEVNWNLGNPSTQMQSRSSQNLADFAARTNNSAPRDALGSNFTSFSQSSSRFF